jgi:hypothetical protein
MAALGFYRLIHESNSSGAYSLNLAAPLDRLAAAWLREDAVDASQRHPGRGGWRNVRLDGGQVADERMVSASGTVPHHALSTWTLPARGKG